MSVYLIFGIFDIWIYTVLKKNRISIDDLELLSSKITTICQNEYSR